MKRSLLQTLLLGFLLISCARLQGDHTGPIISDISTSDKVVVISDCPATAVTITAKVTDESNITRVQMWYRVGSEGTFAFANMDVKNSVYTTTIEGSDLQGQSHGYGSMEFYITADDEAGNSSKSAIDNTIQFLPCVNS